MHINGPMRLAILPAVKRDWITLEIICILIRWSFYGIHPVLRIIDQW